MSQSDYIKYKRVSQELKAINKLAPVLDPNDYVDYKEYSLENSIQNTKLQYNQLIPSGKKIIFNMEKSNTTTCPVFTICKNTNARTNRKPLLGSQFMPKPLRPLTQKQLGKDISELNICVCTNK